MGWKAALDRLAPDLGQVLKRFPLAVTLLALMTALGLGGNNDWLPDNGTFWARLFFGLATGAVFAVSGPLFGESRSDARVATLLLTWLLPIVAVLLFLPENTTWHVPFALPLIALLWLSVSAVTRIGSGEERNNQQDRFWWLVNRALASAAVAIAAFVALLLGTLSIERSLAILFGFETRGFFYQGVLPVVGLFFTPVYWLATLPRGDAYSLRDINEPDFTARAAGFLGPYILVPVLLAYAGILLLYCLQMAVTLSLPNGMLGWMVMGFTITGAAAIVVLHPAFLRDKPVVRFFRRTWWWLTLLPLVLFAIALWVRIDAYGLTPERIGLIWGGVWAALLAAAFLVGRGDIRLVPAFAAALLLIATFGPWNPANLSRTDQARRLELALSAPGGDQAQSAIGRSAIQYLYSDGDEGQAILARVSSTRGVMFDPIVDPPTRLAQRLGFSPEPLPTYTRLMRQRDRQNPIDVAETPLFFGSVSAYGSTENALNGLKMKVDDSAFWVAAQGEGFEAEGRIDLVPFIARQPGEGLPEPELDFSFGGRRFRLVVDSIDYDHGGPSGGRQVYGLSGTLFAAPPQSPMPTP